VVIGSGFSKGADVAEVGFFKRLGNLWKGFLSIWISDVEKEHPEIAYENAINSMVEKYSKLKSATAAIIRRREDTSERFQRVTRELAQTEAELGVAYRPIDELLAESDVISIHTPLTPETENLLSEERIAGIKHNAVVINVARGGVVDEAAMAAALKEERIDGAAFDVFTTEPIAKDNPLLGAPKTILTPHIAGATNESRLRIIDFAIGNIARALAGEKPEDMLDDVPWPRPTA